MSTIWNKYFPYDKPRKEQTNSIEKVIDAFKKGTKYAIVECGTGVGKSAIGLTIAKYINNSSEFESDKEVGAYFLTTQKILQDQYEKDFASSGLISLYSSTNYKCKVDKSATCKEIQTGLRSKSLGAKYSCCGYDCVYKNKKKSFVEKNLGITNFSYFLTEKNYNSKLPNKKVLIIDEAHNLESELTRFIEVSVSEYFSEKILKLKVPRGLNTQFQVFNWIKHTYLPAVISKVEFIKSQLEKFGITSTKLEEFQKITNHFEMISSHQSKIEKFISIYQKDNWVFDMQNVNEKYKKFIFKPIDVSHYSKQYLLDFADYIIFMSATIVSHEGFSLSIGLPKDKTISVKELSPFKPENRPIVFSSAGSMSAKNIDKTLPVMSNMIKSILSNHSKEKGIIHTHSIKVANEIKNRVKDKRLIIAYGADREKMLAKHLNSSKPTVLLSPSMSEGVDLKGSQSQFQIICKIPFPYLGDKVTKKKMHKWKWWYSTQTIRSIIQSVGRSIRSEDDKAVTYILDSDWSMVKSRNKDMFPADFFDNYHEF